MPLPDKFLIVGCILVATVLGPTFGHLLPVHAENSPVPIITGVTFPSSIVIGESASITLRARNSGTTQASEGDIHIALPQNPDSSVIQSYSSDTNQQPPILKLSGQMFNGCNYGGSGCSAHYPSVIGVHTSWPVGLERQLTVSVRPRQAGLFVFEVKVTMPLDGTWVGDPLQLCSICPIDHQGEKVLRYSIDVKATVTFYTNPRVGSITFGTATYADSQSSIFSGGTYTATAIPPINYLFHDWDYSGTAASGVYISSANANPTSVQVLGDGWIRAILSARLEFFADPANGGSISWGSCQNVGHPNGDSIYDPNLPPLFGGGQTTVCANPSSGFSFSHWSSSGGISVTDEAANPSSAGFSGPGTITAIFATVPEPPGIPSEPLNPQASGDAGAINLSWSTPASQGSSPVTSYKIYRGTSSAPTVPYVTVGTVQSYRDSQVVPGTRYFYKISAINSAGEGPSSTEVSAIPSRAPSSLSVTVNVATLPLGATSVVRGAVSPPHLTSVQLTYASPDGRTNLRSISTDSAGAFVDEIEVDRLGVWSVSASWPGDSDHLPAQSSSQSFSVFQLPIQDASLGSRFMVETRLVSGEWGKPNSLVDYLIWDIALRAAELIAELTPQVGDELVGSVLVLFRDLDGDGNLSIEEMGKNARDAIPETVAKELVRRIIQDTSTPVTTEAAKNLVVTPPAQMPGVASPAILGSATAFTGIILAVGAGASCFVGFLCAISIFGFGTGDGTFGIFGGGVYSPGVSTAMALSKTDIEIKDSLGRTLSKSQGGIPGAIYVEHDVNGDGETDDTAYLLGDTGLFTIRIIPEPGVTPDDRVTLILGTGSVSFTVLDNVRIIEAAQGEFTAIASHPPVIHDVSLTNGQVLIRTETGVLEPCSPSCNLDIRKTLRFEAAIENVGITNETSKLRIVASDETIAMSEQFVIGGGQEISLSLTLGQGLICSQPAGLPCPFAHEGTFLVTFVVELMEAQDSDPTDNRLEVSSVIVSLLLDITPPLITPLLNPPQNAFGWNSQDVALTWVVSDAESGIFSAIGCNPIDVLTETLGTTFTCSAINHAGLTGSSSVTVRIDKTAPKVIECKITPTANLNGWHSTDVTVECQFEDALSGIPEDPIYCIQLIGVVCPQGGIARAVLRSEGAGQTVDLCALDHAGNVRCQNIGPVNIDKTTPQVTATPDRSPDHNDWYNHPVTIGFTADDDSLSPIDSCQLPVKYGAPDSDSATVLGQCVDMAGNIGWGEYHFQYDATPPNVNAIPERSADNNGWYNHPFTITFGGIDAISGIDKCDPAYSHSGPDSPGLTIKGECIDRAGNVGSDSYLFRYDATAPRTTIEIGPPHFTLSIVFVSRTTLFSLVCDGTVSGSDRVGYGIDDPSITSNYQEPFFVREKGNHTIYFGCVDIAGNIETTQTLEVVVDATRTTYLGTFEGQYSDSAPLEALVIELATQQGISGKQVKFSLGSQSSTGLTDEGGLATTSIVLRQQAGLYAVSAMYLDDSSFVGSSDSASFTILKENLNTSYSGDTVLSTTVVSINLRATVQEARDGMLGDLNLATVTFRVYASTSTMGLGTPLRTIGPISVSPTTVQGIGVATAQTPNLPEGAYLVLVNIDVASNQFYAGLPSDLAALTIYQPTGSYATGGGWVEDPSESHGNFGFVVRYTKSGQVKGQSVYVYRMNGLDYIVKSNAWIGLAISGNCASFQGKATLQIFDPSIEQVISSEGNYQFTVRACDHSGSTNNGGVDIFSISVLDKTGLLYHQATGNLRGGNISGRNRP